MRGRRRQRELDGEACASFSSHISRENAKESNVYRPESNQLCVVEGESLRRHAQASPLNGTEGAKEMYQQRPVCVSAKEEDKEPPYLQRITQR